MRCSPQLKCVGFGNWTYICIYVCSKSSIQVALSYAMALVPCNDAAFGMCHMALFMDWYKTLHEVPHICKYPKSRLCPELSKSNLDRVLFKPQNACLDHRRLYSISIFHRVAVICGRFAKVLALWRVAYRYHCFVDPSLGVGDLCGFGGRQVMRPSAA